MEDSCPATPLILTGRDSKSPLQVALSSPESDGMKSPSPGSPDSRCVICLGRLQNKSFTDSCLHQFCFQCLLQWSKIKAECPLCKQPFKSIIHNVRSNLDYDQYHVEHGEPRYVLSDLMHSYNFDLIPVDRRFRYRSTMTREYFRELAESFLAHTRRLPEDSYQINPLVPVDPAPAPNVRRSNRLHANSSQHRPRQRGTSDFRRNIYAQDLWVQNLADISGRYRECTPQFYRENPAQLHRIIPWLNREVNVLLSDCESHAAYVLSRIVALLSQYPIRSREFREEINSYFGDRTDHFIHELYTFARSVYDIAGFDQNAVYGTNPNYATEVQEISSSTDVDSDIEILETVKSEERKSKKPRQGLKKLLLKRASGDQPKSDEPVAGPSGLSAPRVTESIEICESDADEVKVLHYVKPEPEVVTLSSGDEAPQYSDMCSGEYPEVIHSESDSKARRSSSLEEERRRSKIRSGKGKCKSNGYGLKGKQKKKYVKSRKHRSSSTSSICSNSSSSSSSTSSSSGSSTRSTDSHSSYGSWKCKFETSLSSTHKSSSKSKRKKSKICRKKFKKKSGHKSSHKRHKSSSDGERKTKKKRVKSCVIVPSWSGDSSPLSRKKFSMNSEEPKGLKSYWSIALSDTSMRNQQPPDRKPKRKHRENSYEDRSKKRNRLSSDSEGSGSESKTSESKTTSSSDTHSPGSGDVPSSSGIPFSSSSAYSFPYLYPSTGSSQNSSNPD